MTRSRTKTDDTNHVNLRSTGRNQSKECTPSPPKKVVAYSKKHTLTEAHEQFGILRTMINRWMKEGYFERERQLQVVPRRPIIYGGDVDELLLTWPLNACDKQLPVTSQLLKARALELITPTHPQFQASSGWAQEFKKHHFLVLLVKTLMAQELPATLEERISAFHSQLR